MSLSHQLTTVQPVCPLFRVSVYSGALTPLLFRLCAAGLEVDLGGSALNVISQFTNPLLNLTRDLELETASISKAQFVVPWLNRKYSDDELVEAMVQAGLVWKPLLLVMTQ